MTAVDISVTGLPRSCSLRHRSPTHRPHGALLTLGLLCLLAGCAGSPSYTAAPFSAQVIDKETKQPIEGAVVVANWHLVTGSLDGERHVGQLEVKETVTDRNGQFSFEGFTRLNPILAELRGEDPRVLIFKGGYKHRTFSNFYPRANTQTPGSYRKAWVDGRVVELERLVPVISATNQIYLHSSLNDLGLEQIVRDCQWHKMPRLLRAMEEEYQRLKTEYPRAILNFGIESFSGYSKPECKLGREFLQEHPK